MEDANFIKFQSVCMAGNDYEITFRLHGESFFEPVDVCLRIAPTGSIDDALDSAKVKLRGALREMYDSIKV